MFIEKGALKLRHLEYSFQKDRYEPKDLTKLAEHIAGSGFSRLTYQEGKTDTIWCIIDSNKLAGFTYDQSEGVMAWSRHPLGNNREDGRHFDEGFLKDIQSIPRADNDDQLWLAALQGSEVNISYMEDPITFPRWEHYFTGSANFSADRTAFLGDLFYQQQRAIHMDSTSVYNGSEASGVFLTLAAVTGNTITLTASASYFLAADVGREIWGQTSKEASLILSSGADVPYGKAIIRTFNSATEVIVDIYEDFSKVGLNDGASTPSGEDEWYLTASTVSGLGHLTGETVGVIVDGEEHPDVLVTSDGVAVLERQGAYIQFGYRYIGKIKSVDIETGGTIGPAQGKPRNVAKCGVKFQDTVSCKVGSDLYNLEEILFRDSQAIQNRPAELFTGEKMIHFEGDWTREKNIFIIQDKAQPCTVVMLNPYVSTSND